MKLTILLLLALPVFTFSQGSSATKIKSTQATEQTGNKFVINGAVTGFPDGTSVSFLNEQTGQPEKQATIQNGKFFIKKAKN